MIVIGITGPTGAGKTTALRQLEGLGGGVIDCDAVYHQLLKSNVALQIELEGRFGDLRDEQGCLNRKRLGGLVFGDEGALAELERITHPYIAREIDRLIEKYRAEGRAAVAVDAIALVESGRGKGCDATVAVLAPPEERIARIMAREGLSREYALARVAAQKPDSFYREHCTHILYNDGQEKDFIRQAQELFQTILAAGDIREQK